MLTDPTLKWEQEAGKNFWLCVCIFRQTWASQLECCGFVSKREVWQKVLMKTRLISRYSLKIHCICHCEHLHLLIANIKKALWVHLLQYLIKALNVQGIWYIFEHLCLGKDFLVDFKIVAEFFWNLLKMLHLFRSINQDQILTVTPLSWPVAEEHWDQNWTGVMSPALYWRG